MSRNNVLLSCYVVTMVEEPDRVVIPVSTPLGTPVPTVLENSLRVTLTTHTIRTVSVACIRSVASLVWGGGGLGLFGPTNPSTLVTPLYGIHIISSIDLYSVTKCMCINVCYFLCSLMLLLKHSSRLSQLMQSQPIAWNPPIVVHQLMYQRSAGLS